MKRNKRCDVCNGSKLNHKLFKCNRCKNRYYCSKQCQKNDWNDHRNKCHLKAAYMSTSFGSPVGSQMIFHLVEVMIILVVKMTKNQNMNQNPSQSPIQSVN